jgi:hypothetical protein
MGGSQENSGHRTASGAIYFVFRRRSEFPGVVPVNERVFFFQVTSQEKSRFCGDAGGNCPVPVDAKSQTFHFLKSLAILLNRIRDNCYRVD